MFFWKKRKLKKSQNDLYQSEGTDELNQELDQEQVSINHEPKKVNLTESSLHKVKEMQDTKVEESAIIKEEVEIEVKTKHDEVLTKSSVKAKSPTKTKKATTSATSAAKPKVASKTSMAKKAPTKKK